MPSRRDPYQALRHGPYRKFLVGRAVYQVGAQMQNTAVGWLVYERFGSKLALGYIGLVQIIPVVCLALPAGHVADRLNRQRIILFGLGLYAVCSLALAALAWWQGPAPLIYVLLFVLGVARAFTIPAVGALLPSIIPREFWANAMTWSSSLFELTGLVGPALAGILIAASGGATVVFLATVACTSTAWILFALLRPAARVVAAGATTWRDLVGGFRFMFRTRLLLGAAVLDMLAVLLGGATALLPVVAKDILHVGPQGFGWLRAAPSVGAIGMALLTAHLPPWRRAGRVLALAFAGFGGAIIVFGLSRNFWLSLTALVLTGVFDNLNVVIRQTLVQLITPDQMRGRVTAVNFIFIGLSNELGGFESGLTAQVFGTVASIVGGGIGTLLVLIFVMRLVPPLRQLGRLHEIQPAPG